MMAKVSLGFSFLPLERLHHALPLSMIQEEAPAGLVPISSRTLLGFHLLALFHPDRRHWFQLVIELDKTT